MTWNDSLSWTACGSVVESRRGPTPRSTRTTSRHVVQPSVHPVNSPNNAYVQLALPAGTTHTVSCPVIAAIMS
jgi:hypothetical protein